MLDLKTIFKKFKASKCGNVAIFSAFALPTVTLISFGAYDYGNVVQSGQELKAAAGAAALAAVNEAHIAYSDREDVDLEQLVKETAEGIFQSRIATIQDADVSNIVITPVVINNVFTVDVSYKAKVKTSVMNLIGFDTFPIGGKQRARVSALSYVNFNFMFDVSGSMGVGATLADMQIMYDEISCAIACHLGSSAKYDKVRAAGATTRIDVAREAARSALNILEERTEVPGHMTVGMHTYDNRATEIADDEGTSNADFNVLRAKLDDVQMNLTHGGSNTDGSMEKVVSGIPESGSGRTADDRIQYLIVLTDGIENSVFYNPGGDEGTPNRRGWDYFRGNDENPGHDFNSPHLNAGWHQKIHAPVSSMCNAAKEKGIEVYFINTEYIVPPTNLQGHGANGDWRFQQIESSLHDLTEQRMKDCAGNPANVIKTSTPKEIENAFTDLIGELSTPLRLF